MLKAQEHCSNLEHLIHLVLLHNGMDGSGNSLQVLVLWSYNKRPLCCKAFNTVCVIHYILLHPHPAGQMNR